LLWHWRALRARRLHADLREQLEQWLLDWQPAANTLVLVGPSAGWTLPHRFLARFETIVAIDLDPSARPLFWLAHGKALAASGLTLHWVHGDFVEVLPGLLSADMAVLFCNVLGQLGVERSDYQQVLAALPHTLRSVHWASYHDRYSADAGCVPEAARKPFESMSGMDSSTLLSMGCKGEWTDHGTGVLLPDNWPRRYLPWLLTARKFHWLEAGTVPLLTDCGVS
jgi:hypothetical protein